VDGGGVVLCDWVAESLPPDTRLVTVMLANHETGAIQPIAELKNGISETIAFHCDAVQAIGKMPVSFRSLGVTSLSLSAHKFHGPRGIGALLCRRGVSLRPLLWGGHQQQGRGPGPEPVGLVVGIATALGLALAEWEQRREHVLRLRTVFLERLRDVAAPVVLNGPVEGGLPHTLNLSFPGLLAESLLMNLDLAGVACSTGSACSSGSLLPSPVLRAMGVPNDVLRSAMRFSFSHLFSLEDIEEAVRRIGTVVQRLRALTTEG